jgi:hypothetical protein
MKLNKKLKKNNIIFFNISKNKNIYFNKSDFNLLKNNFLWNDTLEISLGICELIYLFLNLIVVVSSFAFESFSILLKVVVKCSSFRLISFSFGLI